jgi:hypothetical protein
LIWDKFQEIRIDVGPNVISKAAINRPSYRTNNGQWRSKGTYKDKKMRKSGLSFSSILFLDFPIQQQLFIVDAI